MKKNIVVGLHTLYHDGSITTYDLENKEFKYLKFERLTEVKHQHHNNLDSWIKYLNHLGYRIEDVDSIFLVNCSNILFNLETSNVAGNLKEKIYLIDHHTAHHFSLNSFNSLILDNIGSQYETISIFKKNKCVDKFGANRTQSLGHSLDFLWNLWFMDKPDGRDRAGHTMALAAFGKDFSDKITRQDFLKDEERFKDFVEKNKQISYENNCNNYVCSLHYYWFKKVKNILNKHFNKKSYLELSGGVGENIILNTLLKKEFINFHPSPHCGDEGTSIGALRFGLRNLYNVRSKINILNLHQHDDNHGYASLKTIQKTAQYLKEGKLVMWSQGWGEVGPRALGFRSILMDPCVENAKQVINDKIKKRIWFRPYGASVPTESYKDYFDLDFESPWMLYQAKVKNPVKFKNITHADGTCRIQTVDINHNPSYLKLLKTFGKLSGYPVLINTSMNLPGKPIVGTKKQAKIMFDNSQADVLVMGDEIHIK